MKNFFKTYYIKIGTSILTVSCFALFFVFFLALRSKIPGDQGVVLQATTGNEYFVSTDACADDSKNGLYADCSLGGTNGPFRTIQKAADTAIAGDSVKILPGIYRESVTIKNTGTENARITFEAANGVDTVFIYGSENSESFTWANEGNGIYSTDISTLPYIPELIFETNVSSNAFDGMPNYPEISFFKETGDGIVKYPKAREPDFTVDTYWKFHENWWTADGGSAAENRAETYLTDMTNLSQLPDLTGAMLRMLDTKEAFYLFRRPVISHEASLGRVSWEEAARFDDGTGGIGPLTKYYIEGKAEFLDQAMEWYTANNRLYLKPRLNQNPATLNIEIAVRGIGLDFSKQSYITVKDLNIYFINNLFDQTNYPWETGAIIGKNDYYTKHSDFVLIDNVTIAHSAKGIYLTQFGVETKSGAQELESRSDHITISNCELHNIEDKAFETNSWNHSNGENGGFPYLEFIGNHVHHIGFNSVDKGYGIYFTRAYKLLIEGNYIHDIAHKAISISRVFGDYILVKDNILEKAGLNYSEGGGIGLWGSDIECPKTLIMNNFIKDMYSWTYASWVTSEPGGYEQYPYGIMWNKGQSGSGTITDMARGVTIYRNVFKNMKWEGAGGRNKLFNNTIIGNDTYFGAASGYSFSSGDELGSVYKNNIFLDTKWGISTNPSDVNMVDFNNNLYQQTQEIQSIYGAGVLIHDDPSVSGTENRVFDRVCDPNDQAESVCYNRPWESQGIDNDDQAIFVNPNGSVREDFRLVSNSKAIDAGVEPTEVFALIDELEQVLGITIQDQSMRGSGYDIGAFEFDPDYVEIIIDNSDPGFSTSFSQDSWQEYTQVGGQHYGDSHHYNSDVGTGQDTATWSFTVPQEGNYRVYAWWWEGSWRPADVPYTINHSTGSDTVTVSQQVNGGQWNLLGTYYFQTDGSVVISDNATGGRDIVADAIRLVEVPTNFDLNSDGAVNSTDISILLENWRKEPVFEEADFNSDGVVNLLDFGILANNLG